MDTLPNEILFRHTLMVVVATTCLWTGLTAAFLSRPGKRAMNLTLAVATVPTAWYVFWAGTGAYTVLPGGIPGWPLSQLISGFTTPLMFLLVVQMVRPDRPLPRWMWSLASFGLLGTGFSVLMLRQPDQAMEILRQAHDGELVHRPETLSYWLYVAHSVELLAFAVASLGVLGHAWLRSPFREVRREMGALLAVVVGSVVAVMVSNIAPLITGRAPMEWLGPMAVAPIAVMMLSTMRRSQALSDRLERERAELRRYVPRTVADGVAIGALREAEAEVTVLFSDIRGFTTMTEDLPPSELLQLLQDYLGAMAEVVNAHGGVVDKFIGDAVFAVFGLSEGGHASTGLACAEAMLVRLEALNASLEERGHPRLRIGIGLHSGRVVHGLVGSSDRREYAVLGDTVNTAARVESLTKEIGVAILLTDAVFERLGEEDRSRLDSHGERSIRGRTKSVRVFAPRQFFAAK